MERIDKYVWAVRLAKTRTQATEEIKKGKIQVNDKVVKPSYEVKEKDIIMIIKNACKFTYEVKAILEKRVGAKLVENYITDITPKDELEKYKLKQIEQQIYRSEFGSGKPTKKDRKTIKKITEDY